MNVTQIVALTLLHFLWQGALIHLGLLTVLALTRPRTANARYAISLVAFALMAIAPIATTLRLATGNVSTEASAATAINDPQIEADKVASAVNSVSASPTQASGPMITPVREFFAASLDDRLAVLLPWFVALWITGVILLAARLLGGWLRLRTLVDSDLVPETHQYDDIIRRLCERLGVRRSVRVLESTRISAPAVLGWMRPVLLLPASLSTGLTVAQIETILAHELAHIRRHDYAVNLLQSVIETVLFYHPSVWLLSKKIREEREHCCDDLAVASSGDARVFASALLELEQQRLADMQLAVAATGGSLVRRVRRLLAPSSVEGAEGSRWFAGVFVLAAVLVVAGGARLLRAEPKSETAEPTTSPNEHVVVTDDTVQLPVTPPDTVLLYRGSEELDARDRWAHDEARRLRLQRYWVGYTVEGDVARGWIYFDRHVPVNAGGGAMISGRLRMKETSGLQFSGTRLETLVPRRPASDVAILLRFVVRDSRPVIDRVHAGNFIFPVSLDGNALLWLGESADAPSIALAQRYFADANTAALREEIAAIVGVHNDSERVRPVLVRWLEQSDDDSFRAEVVEWLGYHADALTLGLLARTARDDRSSRVRAEAAKTIGEVELPAALDTLISMTSRLEDEHARREAVEAFGHRSEARALEELRRIAERDESSSIRREAVETLGEIENARALEVLKELAQSHRDEDARREAVETLGERAQTDELISILRRIIDEDRSVNVKREAVETLAERDSRRVLEILAEIAERHPDEEVQREATESLGNASPPEEARRLLERIVRSHARSQVRREAIETLSELLPPDSGAAFFGRVVQGDSDTEMQLTALEALSEMKGNAALEVILEVARAHRNRQVRRKAIELLGESDDPRARTMLERILTRP
jgi:beta-lactamase regulating signal transducer with metallopeptidase domain/HEAT repeat protein